MARIAQNSKYSHQRRRKPSATCGKNLNLSFSASIRCSELKEITRPKAECTFVYVKDKQMNKVDIQPAPLQHSFGHPSASP